MRKSRLLGVMLLILTWPLFAESKKELQFENDKVKVWKTTIPPNDNLKMHRHDHARVVVGLKGGKLNRIEQTGQRSDLVFETGKAYWLDKDPVGQLHGDVNVSPEAVEVMLIEFKD